MLGLDGVVAQRIDIEPVHGHAVPGVRPGQSFGSHHVAEPADQHRDLVGGPGRRLVAPQVIDQAVGAHRVVVVKGQDLEQRPQLATTEERGVTPLHPKVAQQPHPQALHSLHPGPTALTGHRTTGQPDTGVREAPDPARVTGLAPGDWYGAKR